MSEVYSDDEHPDPLRRSYADDEQGCDGCLSDSSTSFANVMEAIHPYSML